MADGLLEGGKRGMGSIWTSVDVNPRIRPQVCIHNLQIMGRDQTIRIEDDKPIAFGAFKPEIPREPLSGVLLPEIMDIQSVLETEHDIPGILVASVFDHNDLKVLKRLMNYTLEELLDFLRSVVKRYDDGKAHLRKYEAKQPNAIHPNLQDPPCILGP